MRHDINPAWVEFRAKLEALLSDFVGRPVQVKEMTLEGRNEYPFVATHEDLTITGKVERFLPAEPTEERDVSPLPLDNPIKMLTPRTT